MHNNKHSKTELSLFRKKVSEWLRINKPKDPGFLLPQTFMEIGSEEVLNFLREWQFKLWSSGFLGMSWPSEFGGQGLPPIFQKIADEEMKKQKVPICFNVIG
ncbi:MAG: acyl-CoA dehydrogenase, partial [Porticoccaceae bacterium]|nr:acyl-CoA dehydrogenase [Porticoccaceae bacterium]